MVCALPSVRFSKGQSWLTQATDSDTPVVEVVDHTSNASATTTSKMSKRELKAYLVSLTPFPTTLCYCFYPP